MLTSGIDFINFNVKKHLSLVKENLISIIKSKNEIVNSLSQNYKNSFSKKILSKYKKVSNYRIIGMGGSTLGTQAIYDFLKHKIKNNFVFADNLQVDSIKEKKKFTNLIVSKSGNTIETIVNTNILIKKKDRNIFITENKNSYLFSLALVSSLMLAPFSFAQDDADVEEVVVTGSKIKGSDLYSFAPITEITQEDIAITGKASIGEILLELPGQGSGLSRNYNNGGSGAVRLDLRNIGSSRNLVLVDGRRWVNSGGGANASVDLNSIPSALVERVEILRDGASAVYGSDAIAGVINIILKDEFEGVEASYQTGEYFDGGGQAETMSLTMGASSDKGSFIAGLSHVDLSQLGNGDRPQTAAAPAGGGSSGTPQGRFAYGGVVGDCSNFTVTEGTPGTNAATDFRCWTSPDDRFNYNPYNYIETPNERWNAFMKGSYKLDDETTFNMNVT